MNLLLRDLDLPTHLYSILPYSKQEGAVVEVAVEVAEQQPNTIVTR